LEPFAHSAFRLDLDPRVAPSAAKQLAKAPFEVTIIDRHNYHLFQPPSYQVVTARAPGAGADLHRQRNPQHV